MKHAPWHFPRLAPVLALVLGGCALGPDFTAPGSPAATRYAARAVAAETVEADGTAQRLAPGPTPEAWWTRFGAPELDTWVAEGLAHNHDLRAAGAALDSAREVLQAQIGSTTLPSVSGQLQQSRQRAVGVPEFGPPTVLYPLYAGVLQVNYDLDLFGAARRGNEAARALVDVQSEELDAARQALAANIVVQAIRSAASARQLALLERLDELARQHAGQVERRFELGAATRAEADEAQRAAYAASGQLAPARAQWDRDRHALAILLGRAPQDAPRDLDFEALHTPAEIPVAVPSELVHARPDIRAAEAALHAATARVGEARARMFPSISLTASYGSESFTRAGFLHSSTAVWGAGASVLQPLFTGGALRAAHRASRDELDAAQERYQAAVIKGFGNVGDSLRALEEDAQALRAARGSRAAAQDLARISEERLAAGSASALERNARAQALAQEDLHLLAARSARLVDTAALFQAIGAPVR